MVGSEDVLRMFWVCSKWVRSGLQVGSRRFLEGSRWIPGEFQMGSKLIPGSFRLSSRWGFGGFLVALVS